MRGSDRYHKWIKWNDEEQIDMGKCPDVVTGIHGDDPVQLYADLCEVVEDVLIHFEEQGRSLPTPKTHLMQEVA